MIGSYILYMSLPSYKNLIVWQKAVELVSDIYKLTSLFPPEEKFNLTSQIKRSAVSIPSNIAEGRMRSTRKDYRSFLFNALGSGAELETQLLLARNLGYGNQKVLEKCENLLNEIMRMLNVLSQRLNK